jgi:hypothetical protein
MIAWRILLIVAAGLGLVVPAVADEAHYDIAEPCLPAPPPECVQELWVVNTRCAPYCQVTGGVDRIRISQLVGGRWEARSLQDFLYPDTLLPTFIWVHGNGLTHRVAMRFAQRFYRQFASCGGSFRFVVFSWPADIKQARRLRLLRRISDNIRCTAIRAEAQGYSLAWLIQQMPEGALVCPTGHSLGAITVVAALHHLAGGQIDGRVLDQPPAIAAHRLRAVLFAPALDCDILLPGYRYGNAFVAAEEILNLYNPQDRVLRFWPRSSPRGAAAIGRVGLAQPSLLGVLQRKYTVFLTTPYVGKRHNSATLWDSPAIARRMHQFFLHDGPPGPPLPLTDAPLETLPP